MKLAEVHRQSQRLIERQSKLGNSMSDFAASMVELGKFESGSLAHKFQQLGARADSLAAATQVTFPPQRPHQALHGLWPCILHNHPVFNSLRRV